MRLNHDHPAQLAAAAASVLRTHPHIVIATADPSGQPWAVPVHQVTLPNGHITWRSARSTRHSHNLAANPQVSGVLYSATREHGEIALYLEGRARAVEIAGDLQPILRHRFAGDQPAPDPADYLGDSAYRMYTLAPTAAWINDDNHRKTAVDLSLLLAHL